MRIKINFLLKLLMFCFCLIIILMMLSKQNYESEYYRREVKFKKEAEERTSDDSTEEQPVSDFKSYKCKSYKRYGASDISAPNDRIDGAYFVCLDGRLRPLVNECTILSFGINKNDRFDQEINERLNCETHSFDPFEEPMRVLEMRSRNGAELKEKVTLKLNTNWFFHSIGITNNARRRNVNKIGWLDTYPNILDHLNLRGRVVDVLKMDVEGAEWESLPYIFETDIGLLCDYVKQIAIETHSWLYNHTHNYLIVKRLEECFRLFRRDHRFYISMPQTEWYIKKKL
jgi:hypothetical protein